MALEVEDVVARCRAALAEHAPALAARDALDEHGGDFFNGERSEWDFDTYEEHPRDLDRTRRRFENANARWLAAR